ncbi:hypothetical protein [Acidovorax sp. SD340]|uniref:hypothetical protein n=1 Tax=Acidovorax sp. SD340 TaxID=1690268 RepID=UPI002100F9E2|nr:MULTISPECIES: hypothetical protein [Acidovorax]
MRGYLRSELVSQVVSSRSVEVVSNLIYAAVHQFGGTIKPKSAKVQQSGVVRAKVTAVKREGADVRVQ